MSLRTNGIFSNALNENDLKTYYLYSNKNKGYDEDYTNKYISKDKK